MGSTTTVRHLLKRLCHNTRWDYAILWKHRQHDHMLQTCEDWYFNSGCEMDTLRGAFPTCVVSAAINCMSYRSYSLGEGVVGEVASTRKYNWTFSSGYQVQAQFPEEWELHFKAGIKTVLLVPVMPLGVVQLGSLDTVLEDLTEVVRISDLFRNVQHNPFTTTSVEQHAYDVDQDISCLASLDDFPFPVNSVDQVLGLDSSLHVDVVGLEFTQSCANFNTLEEYPSSVFTFLEDKELYVNPSINPGWASEQFNPYLKDLASENYDYGFEYKIDDSCFSFPFDSELHKALGCEYKADEQCSSAFVCKEADTIAQLLDDSDVTKSSCKSADSCLSQCKVESAASLSRKRTLPPYENDTNPSIEGKRTKRSSDNTGNTHRPKPRDRQLIQDRIKELRELIPDSSKCSIDALLDQTIKHMKFLQSIPREAEKLRNSEQPMVNGEEWRPSVTHDMGPLIVENLDQPGQILIEMLCEEYGLFLEISQVIKQLRLTLLKGILETRLMEQWAHFIVEVPKGFRQTDILWPLVQLLQRNDTQFHRASFQV